MRTHLEMSKASRGATDRSLTQTEKLSEIRQHIEWMMACNGWHEDTEAVETWVGPRVHAIMDILND